METSWMECGGIYYFLTELQIMTLSQDPWKKQNKAFISSTLITKRQLTVVSEASDCTSMFSDVLSPTEPDPTAESIVRTSSSSFSLPWNISLAQIKSYIRGQ